MNAHSRSKKIRLSNNLTDNKVIKKAIKNFINYKWLFVAILIFPASITSPTPEIAKPVIEIVFRKPERKRENEPHQDEYFKTDLTNTTKSILYSQNAIGGGFLTKRIKSKINNKIDDYYYIKLPYNFEPKTIK